MSVGLQDLDHKKLKLEPEIVQYGTLPPEIKSMIIMYIAIGEPGEICQAVHSWCQTNKHSYDDEGIWKYAFEQVGATLPATQPGKPPHKYREIFNQYCRFPTEMAKAAQSGNIAALQALLGDAMLQGAQDNVRRYREDTVRKALSIAADSEQEEAFMFLYEFLVKQFGGRARDLMTQAAMDGNKTFLRILFRTVYKDQPYFTARLTQMLLFAAEAGLLNMVEWILETYSHEFNEHVRTTLYLISAQRNQFHIVQWIQKQEDQDFGTWGMHHEDVVGQVMILCAKKGRFDLVKWSFEYLHKSDEEMGKEFIRSAIIEARLAGHALLAKWLDVLLPQSAEL